MGLDANVRVNILDAFSSVGPFAPGSWVLRGSPQCVLDIDIKGPAGALCNIVADVPAFRTSDVGKYIRIYGGLIRINNFTDSMNLVGEIIKPLDVDDDDPEPAIAGTWELQENSWNPDNGFPGTVEFYQGRLGFARTPRQPTTYWLSGSDDFENFVTGTIASDAIQYTVASKVLNRIEWLSDNKDLYIGTSGAELVATGGKQDEPIGGDNIPRSDRVSSHGCAPIQPVIIDGHLLFVDRSTKQVYTMIFDLEENKVKPVELTAIADQATGDGIRLGHIAYQKRLDVRAYWVLTNGNIATLTYFPDQKVIGFTRLTTEGTFESAAVKPQTTGRPDHTWVIAKRSINSETKRYVELIDEQVDEVLTRPWQSLQCDCAGIYKGVPTTVITGVGHLEGKTVNIVGDGGARQQRVVSGGNIELGEDPYSEVEYGLNYNSPGKTMRPAMQDQVTDGLVRTWNYVFLRVLNSKGGKINDEWIQYPVEFAQSMDLFTGDLKCPQEDSYDLDGYVEFTQDQPYPMTILALYGEVNFGDKM